MIKQKVYELVKNACEDLKQEFDVNENIPFNVEIPPENIKADFSTNVCLVSAKVLKKSPDVIKDKFIDFMSKSILGKELIQETFFLKPGFINFILKKDIYIKELIYMNKKALDYGKGKKKDKKILIEFVSSNPTGPLHIGHARGAAIGDSLANVLKFSGFVEVHREYYVNNIGRQINLLVDSVKLRLRELLGESVIFSEDYYKGEYITEIAKEIKEKKLNDFDFKNFVIDSIIKNIKNDLKDFGVIYDNWFYEDRLHKKENNVSKVDVALEKLKSKGVLAKIDGAMCLKSEDIENDEKHRVIIRKNGMPTYFASDIAYHVDKYTRGYDLLVDVWGTDHHGYIARLSSALYLLGYKKQDFKVILYQLVTLLRNNRKISMSTRKGEFVTLKEVIKDVGTDAARFFLLMRKSDAHFEFDLDLAKKTSNENPVFYVQYAHARINSLFTEAEKKGFVDVESVKSKLNELLTRDEEISIMKHLCNYSDVVQICARDFSTHYLPMYLMDLVSRFHSYYSKVRIITNDKSYTLAKLFLCKAIVNTIKSGLTLLGVSAPEKM